MYEGNKVILKGDKYMNVIQPFEKRMMIEAIIKSVLVGLLVAICSEIIMIGIAAILFVVLQLATNMFYLAPLIGIPVALLIGVGAAIPTFIKSKRKKLKELGRRLDGLGLAERVTTMEEYRHDNSYVAHIQREDTINRLSKIEPKKLKIKVSKKLITIIALTLVIALLMPICARAALWSDENAPTQEEIEIQDQIDQTYEEIIEEIEEALEKEEINQDQADDLKETLEQWKEQIENATTKEEKEQVNDEFKEKFDEIKQNEQQKQEDLADELQKQEDMKELGEAIKKEDEELIKDVLENMKEKLENTTTDEERQEIVEDMADQLDKVIEEFEKNQQEQNKNEDSPLKDALENFKENLEQIKTNPTNKE